MKVVIIGGGIAGLATAIALKKQNVDVVVREKITYEKRPGMAYLIPEKALEDLEIICTQKKAGIERLPIQYFVLKNIDGTLLESSHLGGWNAVKRDEIIQFLTSQLSEKEFQEGTSFSHFLYEENKAIAAVFKDGSIEYGDVFIGADGIHSSVRNSVCKARFYPNEINEIVCLVKNETPIGKVDLFTKYYQKDQGISFGYIPISDREYVWFNQFDTVRYQSLYDSVNGDLKAVCTELLRSFPDDVQYLLSLSDFNVAHLCRNTGLEMLPNYYKENVCLIGDAAHGSISLTSTGVSSAVADVMEFINLFQINSSIKSVFQQFEINRKKEVQKVIDQAILLKDQFLNREGENRKGTYILPLVT